MSGATLAGRLRETAVEYLPPIRDPRFWVTQGLVVAVFATHAIFHAAVGGYPDAFVTIAYTFPVVYAALVFGWRGSVATTALVFAVSLPYVIMDAMDGDRIDLVGHAMGLAILGAVAPVVGKVVESERMERQAHETAERRYRALFESSGVPAVVLDASGRIQEINPAAGALLRGRPTGRYLADVLGAETAAALLGDRVPERIYVAPGVDLRPAVSHHVGEGGERLTQVVFQDVTEEASEQRRARAWALAVLGAQEDERKRISQELHDQALQLVVELRRRVERAAKASPSTRSELLDASALADQAMEELRTVAVRLRPPDLDDLGLVASLERLVADAQRRGGRTEFLVEGPEAPIPPAVGLAVYRVGQEALNNAEHHAQADRITLYLTFAPRMLRLQVADDGVGFDPRNADDPAGDAHLGLVGMRERMELIGGKLELRSVIGGGTTVTATAPLPSTRSRT